MRTHLLHAAAPRGRGHHRRPAVVVQRRCPPLSGPGAGVPDSACCRAGPGCHLSRVDCLVTTFSSGLATAKGMTKHSRPLVAVQATSPRVRQVSAPLVTTTLAPSPPPRLLVRLESQRVHAEVGGVRGQRTREARRARDSRAEVASCRVRHVAAMARRAPVDRTSTEQVERRLSLDSGVPSHYPPEHSSLCLCRSARQRCRHRRRHAAHGCHRRRHVAHGCHHRRAAPWPPGSCAQPKRHSRRTEE